MNEAKKPVALILGGTNPHVELVKKLKARGYYTVLVDYLPNPPAKEIADEHIQESTLDNDKVVEVAKEKQAKLIITTNSPFSSARNMFNSNRSRSIIVF